jgi:hypothetical protein
VTAPIECVVEVGAKRSFAAAAAWPGWCRSAKAEDEALETLVAYGERYAAVLSPGGPPFTPPRSVGDLLVVERAPGNATTEFGAPDAVFDADADADAIAARGWTRLRSILEACWTAFDQAATQADGVVLRKGPRGGGRELDAIVAHVTDAEVSYLRRLTGAAVKLDAADAWASRLIERAAVLDGLERAKAGTLPEAGPRGGVMWTPRRFLRRAAWHVLDHAWEIGDRASG